MSDSSEMFGTAESAAGRRRVIKRYSNRKLYDTTDSKYVTLLELADLIRAGEEVQVIDTSTTPFAWVATLTVVAV